ncbi:hypothetical protein GCM10010182_67720 [Actinomadura cremea]|nr:hypothetical protein GCM10010182_67720 [Actinomadura cremea]
MGHVARIGTGVASASSSTGTITLTAGAAVDEAVVVGVVWESGAGTIPTITSVVDSSGNTYMVDRTAGGSGNATAAVALARAGVTSALDPGDTITVTISGGTRARWALVAESFDDVAASPLDKTAATDNGNSGSLTSGVTSTTTQAAELCVAVFGFGQGRTVTIPDGWSGGAKVESAAGSSDRAVQLIYRYVSVTGAQEGTLGISPSGVYAGLIATYKVDTPSASGTGEVSDADTLSATGTKGAPGAATASAEVTVSATGTKHASGSARVEMALGLSARGEAETGIGLPPRPRTRWQLVLGPASGGHELALTEASSRRYTARLNEGSDLSFSIDGRHAQAAAIGELTTDVHLLWTSPAGLTRVLDRCRVGPTRDDVSEDAHRVEVTCLDYRAVLERRILYSGDTLTYSSTDQAEVAWALIDTTQQRAAGALGIAKGWTGTAPTGITRDRTYEASDSIGQRIQELSEVIDGFDWDITPVSASGLRLDVWYPQRGADRGVVLILGGLAATVNREVNPGDYANALRYSGATGDEETPGPTPVELEAPLLDQAVDWPQGRWDAAHGDDGLVTQAALNARAAWQLAQSQVITPVYTVRLVRGGWDGPDHIWLGDTVRLIVPSGRLQVDSSLRVHEVQIDIDEDGGETVTLSLGGPRPDFRRWPSRVDRKIRDLERR